jgi:hypothetical protein
MRTRMKRPKERMMGRLAAAAIIGLLAASLAQAQTTPAPDAPDGKLETGVVTPERVTQQIEEWAKQRQESGGPSARVAHVWIFFAGGPNEFAALGRYSVLLLTVVTQRSEELPLKRVYIRANDQDVPVQKISTRRGDVDSALLTHKIYGPYRETGFYLIPTGMTMREGQLLADFAANRTAMPILQLPNKGTPDQVKRFPNLDPTPRAKPELKVLQTLLEKQTAGFPIPRSLP